MNPQRNIGHAATALIALFLFAFTNAIAGLWNDAHAMTYYGSGKVFEALPFHLIFLVLFWLSALPNIPVRATLRLPLLQVVFWIWVAQGINGATGMATWDFIDACIPPFCFFLGPLERAMPAGFLYDHPYIHVYGLLIAGVTIYKIIVLEVSRWLATRYFERWSAAASLNVRTGLS